MIRPPPFAQAEATSHSEIQDEFAEPFLFQPMVTRPNFPPCPDSSRGRQLVRVTFFWDNHDQKLGMREAAIVSRKPMGSIHKGEMAGQPRRGDTFTRQADGETFEVTKVERDGLTGIMVEFVQLGVQD